MTEEINTETPDGIPALTAAELKTQREYLGLSTGWMAEKLVIGERRIQRMESGQETIPEAVIELIDEIHDETKTTVEQLIAVYRRKVKAGGGEPVLLPTYRTDKHTILAGKPYPSRWYRHVAARVADACAGAIIVYEEPVSETGDEVEP